MKRYKSANDRYRELFGEKTYKLALQGGATCPNRDGKKGFGGCIFCGEEVNHIECKSAEDVEIFKENFEKGVYQDEAEESISYLRAGWIGQNDLDKKANRNGELSMPAYLS